MQGAGGSRRGQGMEQTRHGSAKPPRTAGDGALCGRPEGSADGERGSGAPLPGLRPLDLAVRPISSRAQRPPATTSKRRRGPSRPGPLFFVPAGANEVVGTPHRVVQIDDPSAHTWKRVALSLGQARSRRSRGEALSRLAWSSWDSLAPGSAILDVLLPDLVKGQGHGSVESVPVDAAEIDRAHATIVLRVVVEHAIARVPD